jgi:uncharacterized membrane protein (UPF0127 family)
MSKLGYLIVLLKASIVALSSAGLMVVVVAAPLPTIELRAGQEKIQAQVASTPESQQLGLMYRKSMPANEGMLFAFSSKAGHCFWMKNTELPLAIAFIGDDGRIVNIEEMLPQTENNHCPLKPVRFALEMNKGWFAQKKLGPGSLIEGLPKP